MHRLACVHKNGSSDYKILSRIILYATNILTAKKIEANDYVDFVVITRSQNAKWRYYGHPALVQKLGTQFVITDLVMPSPQWDPSVRSDTKDA
jgi:hypothetical protein